MENTEILTLVKDYIKAIHTQDVSDFRSLWSGSSTDTMISVAKVFQGLDAIVDDFLIGAIQKLYSNIDLIADEKPEIHMLSDDTAVVIFQYHTECTLRDSGEAFGISGMETQVVRCIAGSWKLCHIHYSKVG